MVEILRDITERKKAEHETLRQTSIIKAINKVFEKVLTTETEEELGQTCLEVAQELSGAKFGFFGKVNNEGKFDIIAISNSGWEVCKMPGSNTPKIIKGMEIRGMQFLPLIDGKSWIFNDPSNHPDSVGTPDGHPELTCLLAVPLKHKGIIFGEIGLGNKEEGFDEHDKKAIEALSIAIMEALLKNRVEKKIKKSEENLRVSNENLKKVMGELKRSNKELEQFAYVASHDLQEPLRMVASFTQLLQNRYQDKLVLHNYYKIVIKINWMKMLMIL
jgi:transcriptional regulator with GAF, ATPase, and Fis domain